MCAQVFVAISTGQNIANVLPILERAHTGDTIILLESPSARARGWSKGMVEVLTRHGLERLQQLALTNDTPRAVAEAMQTLVQAHGPSLILIANGGTKLQALAAYLHPQLPLLYNLDTPAAYEWYPQGIHGPVERRPYTRHRLQLDDLLLLRGKARKGDGGLQLWGEGANAPHPVTDYGRDEAYTLALHDQFATLVLDTLPHNIPGDHHWAMIKRHQREPLETLRRSLEQWAHKSPNDGLLQNIVFKARKLLDEALRLEKQAQAQQPVRPKTALGPLFEQAVAQRLLDHLAQHPAQAAVVQSVWSQVKIGAHDPNQAQNNIEIDVLVLLKNGILWNIECKSHTAENKDLDARLLNLQTSGSLLARMAICAPCFTACTDRPWFKAQHELKERVKSLGNFFWLPFDLPGQPKTYTAPWENDSPTYTCGGFEEQLERLLKPYQP